MVIIEEQLNGIVTDLLDTIDVDILFTELQFFLPGPVTLDFSRRGIHAQILGRQIKTATIIKGNFQHMAGFMQVDLGWLGCVGHAIPHFEFIGKRIPGCVYRI